MTIVKLKIHPSSPRIGKGTPLSESFRDYTLGLIGRLRLSDRCRTAESYLTSFNSFMRFRDDVDVSLDKIDADLMTAYEGYLRREGICPNTSSYYMRNLRAIYNRAVEDGLTVQCYPFRRVYTGIDRTVKRAVPLQVIGRIRNLDLSLDPRLDYARDLFMFSFYTRGMSFVDMAYLKKKDLRGGFLSYYPHNTPHLLSVALVVIQRSVRVISLPPPTVHRRQFLSVRWARPMQAIVEKYDTADTPYLLPIIRDVSRDDRNQYLSASHQVNIRLKELGARLGLDMPLTTYVARHAWASIAWDKRVSMSVISRALGHHSEHTTRIYLASLDTSAVDCANRDILKALDVTGCKR